MPYITKDDGTFSANTANVETSVFDFKVPKTLLYELLTRPLEIFLMRKESFNGNGSATQFTVTGDIVDSPNLTDTDGNVLAYVGGSKVTISSVNFSTKVVTLASAPSSGTNNVEIYYVFGNANLKIRVYNPIEGRNMLLYNGRIENLHVNNQYSELSAQRLKNVALLDEDWKIKILLKSANTVSTDANATTTTIKIPYMELPRSESDLRKVQEQLSKMGD